MSFGRTRGWRLVVVLAMISASLAEAQQPRPPDAGRVLKDAPQPPALPQPQATDDPASGAGGAA